MRLLHLLWVLYSAFAEIYPLMVLFNQSSTKVETCDDHVDGERQHPRRKSCSSSNINNCTKSHKQDEPLVRMTVHEPSQGLHPFCKGGGTYGVEKGEGNGVVSLQVSCVIPRRYKLRL